MPEVRLCSKYLVNGMCGESCKVGSNRDLGWHLIYNRLKELGKLDDLRKVTTLRDCRKLDVPDTQRTTTRWALGKREICEASK